MIIYTRDRRAPRAPTRHRGERSTAPTGSTPAAPGSGRLAAAQTHAPVPDGERERRVADRPAPGAFIVPQTWFQHHFRQVSLYFFDPTASILVPEPVFVPRGRSSPPRWSTALLDGPVPGWPTWSRSICRPGCPRSCPSRSRPAGCAVDLTSDSGDAASSSAGAVGAAGLPVRLDAAAGPEDRDVRGHHRRPARHLRGGDGVHRRARHRVRPVRRGLQHPALRAARRAARSAAPRAPRTGDGDVRPTRLRLRHGRRADLRADQVAGGLTDGDRPAARPRQGQRRPRRRADQRRRGPAAPGLGLHRPAVGGGPPRTGAVVYVLRHRGGTSPVAVDVPGISGPDVKDFLVSRDGTRLVAVIRDGRRARPHRGQPDPDHRDGRVVRRPRPPTTHRPAEPRAPIRDIGWRSPTSVAVLHPVSRSLFQVRQRLGGRRQAATTRCPGPIDERRGRPAGTPVPDETLYAFDPAGHRRPAALADLAGPRANAIDVDPRRHDRCRTSAEPSKARPVVQLLSTAATREPCRTAGRCAGRPVGPRASMAAHDRDRARTGRRPAAGLVVRGRAAARPAALPGLRGGAAGEARRRVADPGAGRAGGAVDGGGLRRDRPGHGARAQGAAAARAGGARCRTLLAARGRRASCRGGSPRRAGAGAVATRARCGPVATTRPARSPVRAAAARGAAYDVAGAAAAPVAAAAWPTSPGSTRRSERPTWPARCAARTGPLRGSRAAGTGPAWSSATTC